MVSRADAAKVMIDKPADEPVRGEVLTHRPIAPEVLEDLRATLLAEYATAVLVEIADEDLERATTHAVEARLGMTLHEEYDRLWINGFEYLSGAPCPVLRPDQLLLSIPERDGLWVVQMIGPPTSQWHETLRAAGEVINVYPANTFVIRADRVRAEALRNAEGFQHVEPYQSAFKIQPRLARAPGTVRAIVQLDAGRDLDEAYEAIEAMAERRFYRETKGLFRNLLVELSPEQIRQLAQRPEVVWMEPYTRPGFSDERHAMVVAGEHDGYRPNEVTPGNDDGYQHWLESKGFCGDPPTPGCIDYSTRVAVFDSGLDINELNTQNPYGPDDYYNEITGEGVWVSPGPGSLLRHEDLANREERFFCIEKEDEFGFFSNRCRSAGSGFVFFDFSDENFEGHGTSVASIIAGDPIAGTGATDSLNYLNGSGIAPRSNIVVAKMKGEFSPIEYERLMAKVMGIGTRFASNSWNVYADWDEEVPSNPFWPDFYHDTKYNAFSKMADQLVRDGDGGFDDFNNEMTIVFSAGNYLWRDHNPPFPDPNPDFLTIAPGNAKNIISVGASSGWELPSEGRGCCDQYAGTGEPPCAVDGIPEDDISDVLHLSTRGTGSSQARFKPDLVAPGTRLKSAVSTTLDSGGESYHCFGATSGATPLVTGAAILVDAWYSNLTGGLLHPSPALIKAILIAHAANLGPSANDLGEGGLDRYTNQALPHSPSLAQGWGRLELEGVFSPGVATVTRDEDHREDPPGPLDPPPRRFRNDITTWSESFTVDQTGQDVIIVMAFTDAPGAPGALNPAVNDLNLVVVDGEGMSSYRYYGNRFKPTGYHSKRHLTFFAPQLDSVNNVEVIRFPASEITNGDFTVEVYAQTLGGIGVPGLDEGVPNQDFALYVFNANRDGGSFGGMP